MCTPIQFLILSRFIPRLKKTFLFFFFHNEIQHQKLSSRIEELQAQLQMAQKAAFESQLEKEQLHTQVQTARKVRNDYRTYRLLHSRFATSPPQELLTARKEAATLRDSNEALVETQHATDKKFNKEKVRHASFLMLVFFPAYLRLLFYKVQRHRAGAASEE